jgi:hypothetical protein
MGSFSDGADPALTTHGMESIFFGLTPISARGAGNSSGERSNVGLQGDAQPAENGECQIPLPAFDASNIGAIDLGNEREIFLRPTQLLSALPDALSERAKVRIGCHPHRSRK